MRFLFYFFLFLVSVFLAIEISYQIFVTFPEGSRLGYVSRWGEFAEEIFYRDRPKLEGMVEFYVGSVILFLIFMFGGHFLFSRLRKSER